MRLTITASLAADAVRRTIVGTVYRYGEIGQTTAGPLAVAASMPPPPVGLPLTVEHDNAGAVRGRIAQVDNNDERLRVAVRVTDDELGDQALAEAASRDRAGLSFYIEDAEVVEGAIVSGRWVALGQVAEPAYNSARIDQIAASSNRQENRIMLTEQQRARLNELQARTDLNDDETNELNALLVLAGDPAEPTEPTTDPTPAATTEPAAAPAESAPVAASMPAVPAGIPRPAARTQPRAGALDTFVAGVMQALQPGGGGAGAIAAAFTDVTQTAHSHTEAPAWSGELWSGLQYEPQFTPLLNSGTLTSWSGAGWRWVTKPQMQDYAGDKAAVPSNVLDTEPGGYSAARMACGHDFDRKFVDFPGGAEFLRSAAEAAREDWAVKLDAKVEAFIIANAVPSAVAPGAGTVISRLARLVRFINRQRLGRSPFIVLNDNDYDRLFDINEDQMPAFFELTGVKPENIVSSANVPADTAIAGAKQAATVRTLPGSPIRVDAQNLANGGVDSAFFGYWAIEEHHTSGIRSMDLGFVA